MKKARKKSPSARRRQTRPKADAKRAARPFHEAQTELSESGLLREITEHTGVSPEMLNARDRRRWRIEQHNEEDARDADGAC